MVSRVPVPHPGPCGIVMSPPGRRVLGRERRPSRTPSGSRNLGPNSAPSESSDGRSSNKHRAFRSSPSCSAGGPFSTLGVRPCSLTRAADAPGVSFFGPTLGGNPRTRTTGGGGYGGNGRPAERWPNPRPVTARRSLAFLARAVGWTAFAEDEYVGLAPHEPAVIRGCEPTAIFRHRPCTPTCPPRSAVPRCSGHPAPNRRAPARPGLRYPSSSPAFGPACPARGCKSVDDLA